MDFNHKKILVLGSCAWWYTILYFQGGVFPIGFRFCNNGKTWILCDKYDYNTKISEIKTNTSRLLSNTKKHFWLNIFFLYFEAVYVTLWIPSVINHFFCITLFCRPWNRRKKKHIYIATPYHINLKYLGKTIFRGPSIKHIWKTKECKFTKMHCQCLDVRNWYMFILTY